MTIADWLLILAVIAGPILAVQVQKWLDLWREKRNRKLHIFASLMTTRGTPVSPQHVEALNMIDLQFNTKKSREKEIVDSWKVYRDHLYSGPKDYKDPSYQSKLDIWSQKSKDLLTDLLSCMACVLGYEFDKVQLKKGCYTPQGYADLEMEHSLIRRGLLDILYGHSALPIERYQSSPLNTGRIEPEAEGDHK